MIGTAFSMAIRLELAGGGEQYLQGDHQLYNGALFNLMSSLGDDIALAPTLHLDPSCWGP